MASRSFITGSAPTPPELVRWYAKVDERYRIAGAAALPAEQDRAGPRAPNSLLTGYWWSTQVNAIVDEFTGATRDRT
jgi:hypothetical protein